MGPSCVACGGRLTESEIGETEVCAPCELRGLEELSQDFYEDALTDLARSLGIDPSPFITIRSFEVGGPLWAYAYVGAKNDLRAAIRAERESRKCLED